MPSSSSPKNYCRRRRRHRRIVAVVVCCRCRRRRVVVTEVVSSPKECCCRRRRHRRIVAVVVCCRCQLLHCCYRSRCCYRSSVMLPASSPKECSMTLNRPSPTFTKGELHRRGVIRIVFTKSSSPTIVSLVSTHNTCANGSPLSAIIMFVGRLSRLSCLACKPDSPESVGYASRNLYRDAATAT